MFGQTIMLDEIERKDRESFGFTNLIEDRNISYPDCQTDYLNSTEIMNHQLYTISNTLGIIAFVNNENCIKISSTFEIHEYIQKKDLVPKPIYEYKLDSTPSFIKFSENGMNLVFSVKNEIIIFNFTKDLKFKQSSHKFDSEIIEFDCKLDKKIFIVLNTNETHYLNYEHEIVVKKLNCVSDCSTISSNNKIVNNYLLVGTSTSDIILVDFEKDLVLFKCKIGDIERTHCLNWFDNFYCTFSTFTPYNDAVDFKIVILQLNHECFIGQPSDDKELVIQGAFCMEFFPDISKPVDIDNTCRYHTLYLDHWKILLCSTTTDSRVVVLQQDDEGKFNLLALDGKWSIDTFPLYEEEPTFSLGLVADFGYDFQIDNIKSKTDAPKHEASPLIHIYLTSGFIVTYSFTNCDETKKYPLVHATQPLGNLKIEELKEEKKEEPKVEEKIDSPLSIIEEVVPPVKEDVLVKEIIPEVKKSPEIVKQPLVEQPKFAFNPIPTNTGSTSGGFTFGNTDNSTFNFNSTKPTQPTVTTQPNTNLTFPTTNNSTFNFNSTTKPIQPTVAAQPNTGSAQKPFTLPMNPAATQPILTEPITQKQPLAQPKSKIVENFVPVVTTGIVDKNMIQSMNNFSSNLTSTNVENGTLKKEVKPVGKPLKHEPINPISLIPNTKPLQNPSKPSPALGTFKNDLAVIQSKASKSKSDEKIQQLSKETAKKVLETKTKFSMLKNVIENINNNQENDLKFTKSDISTIRSNIDKLNDELIKTDEALKQRVERLNEYLNRECSIVELLDIKIQQNRKEPLKEAGLDETAQYFKDIISHKFNNIITNIEDLESQVKRKLNLTPQKTPTLICLQNTLSLQRNRAVEYRKYVLSIAKKLHSKEHISSTDLFIQNLSMTKAKHQPIQNANALRKIQMTTIKPIVNNSSILKKKISLVQEDETNLFQDYENIDEISEIYYDDEESKNPLNESFIQSENSSLDLLDEDEEEEEDEEYTETTSPINFNSNKPNFSAATTSLPQANSFIPPKQTTAGFSFGESKTTAFAPPLSNKTNIPSTQFNLTTAPKKETSGFSMPKSESSPALTSLNSGSSTTKTDTKPANTGIALASTVEKKEPINFGTTPGFNFGKKEESTTLKSEPIVTGFVLPKKEETKPSVTPTTSSGFSFATKPEASSATPSILGTDAKKETTPVIGGFSFSTKTETTGASGFNFGTKKEEPKTEPIKTESKSVDSESTSAKFETKPLTNSFSTTPFGVKKEDPKVEEPKKESLNEKKEEIKPSVTPTTSSGFSFAPTKPTSTTPSSGFSFATTSMDTKKEPTPSVGGFSFATTASKTEAKNESESVTKEETKAEKIPEKSEVSETPKQETKSTVLDFGKKEDSNISDIFPTKKISTTPVSSEKSSFFESPPAVTDSKVLLTGFANTAPTNEKLSFNFSSSTPSTENKIDSSEIKKEEPKTEPIKEEPKKEEPIIKEEIKIEQAPKKEETKPATPGFNFSSTPNNAGFNFENTKLPESKPVEVSTPKTEEAKPVEPKSNSFATNPFNNATTIPPVTKPVETNSFTSTPSPITTTTTSNTIGFTPAVTITQPKDENGMEDNDDVMIGSSGMGSLSLGTTSNNSTTPSGFTSFLNNSGSSTNISSAFPSNNTITTFNTGNNNTSGSGGSFFEPVHNSVGDSPFSNPTSNSSLPFSFQGNSSFGAKGSFSFDSGRTTGSSAGSFGTSGFGNTNNNSVLTSGFGSNTLNTDTSKTFGTSFGSSGFASKSNTQPATSGGFGSGGFGSGGFGSGSFGNSTSNSNTQPTSGGFGSGGFAGTSGSSGFGALATGSSPFSTLGSQGTPSFLQGNNSQQPTFGNNNTGNSFGSFGSFGAFGRTN